MRPKPSRLGKGGIHQAVWDNMRPNIRRLFDQIYPDRDDSGRSWVLFVPASFPTSTSTEMSMDQFKPQPRHYIGFRVIALDGLHPNHAGCRARSQQPDPTIESARRHLLWLHFASPWISIFTSWHLAIRRARYFTRECGARRVSIMVIDMGPIETSCIDAYEFALAYDLAHSSVYQGEVLCFNEIPNFCLLAEIPAVQPVPTSAPWGRLKVPEDLLHEARLTYSRRLSPCRGWQIDELVRDCEAVRCWLFDAIWSRSISEPHAKTAQIMQSFGEG